MPPAVAGLAPGAIDLGLLSQGLTGGGPGHEPRRHLGHRRAAGPPPAGPAEPSTRPGRPSDCGRRADAGPAARDRQPRASSPRTASAMAAPSAAWPASSRCTPSSGLTCATEPASKKPTPLPAAISSYMPARRLRLLDAVPEAPHLAVRREHHRHGRHQEHARRRAVRTGQGPAGQVDERAGAAGDLRGGLAVDALQVVGAEHDDDEVHRPVREQARREVVGAVAARLDGRIPDGAAAVEALLDDLVALAQRSPHDARPAHVARVAASDRWVGMGPVRVRIPEADDGAGHALPPGCAVGLQGWAARSALEVVRSRRRYTRSASGPKAARMSSRLVYHSSKAGMAAAARP